MALTYTLIASNTLGSSAASVTFSSIPSTYTDLVFKFSARTDYTVVSFDNLRLSFNSDSSSLYSRTTLQGNGSTASSSRSSNDTYNMFLQAACGANTTSNTFSNAEIYIPNYLSTSNKALGGFTVSETNDVSAQMQATAALYRNTTTLSSLTLISNSSSNFVSGSSFFLYGIKNS